MKNNKSFKNLFLIGIIAFILVVTFGVSYAFFSYIKAGEKENVIQTGNLTFRYSESQLSSNGIKLLDAYPISDSEGKTSKNDGYFDFTIEADTSSYGLRYYIVLEESSDNELNSDCLKLYMTELNDANEIVISTTLNNDGSVKSIDQYSEAVILNSTGKIIYNEEIEKGNSNYLKKYRVRMWLRDDVDLIGDKYDRKSGSYRINVYAIDID